jgi:uncharacterized protein YegL
MLFRNLFGRKPQTKKEETIIMEKKVMEQKEDKMNGLTSVYHLIVLDESGSMSCVTNQTISGCNETIQTIRLMQDNNKDTQTHYVSVYLFESGRSRYIIHNQPVVEVKDITHKDYCPNGCTPLFDALGFTLMELKEIMGTPDTLGYVTIITDGEENSSRRYSLHQVRELIDELKKRDVIFSFIGANIDAAEYAKNLNISNSMQFVQDDEGTRAMWERERRGKMRSGAKMSFMKKFASEEFNCCFSISENSGSYYQEEVDKNRVTPAFVNSLKENEIFVFGSNVAGNHNGGAAGYAKNHFGAIDGQAEGLQGQSYAIPTDGVSEKELYQAICRFCDFASSRPELTFYVTAIGCGNAGFSSYTVAPMFCDAVKLKNVKLPIEFWDFLTMDDSFVF